MSDKCFNKLVLCKYYNYTLNMYNVQGRLTRTFFKDRMFARGHHIQNLNLSGISAGVYIIRLHNQSGIKFIKMLN